MIFSVSVASFALGAYQSSRGRRGAGRHRQRERAMAGGKYTWLHNKAKWRVLVLYPLTWISVSISPAPSPSPPLAGLASTRVSDIKLTGSPLAVHPQLRVNRHMFLRGTFSLRPQGSRGRGVLFSSPTQNIHTGRLCEMCVRRIYVRRPHWHANVFRTDEPQLAQCGRGQQSGLTWNRTAGKEINDTA